MSTHIGACVITALIAVAPAAQAAITSGSTAQFVGIASFSGDRAVDFVSLGAAPAGFDAAIRVGIEGNTGSFAGFNQPNQNGLPFAPNYVAGVRDLPGADAIPAGNFLSLPGIVIGAGEIGPSVGTTRFVLSSLNSRIDVINGASFFELVGQGTITDLSDGSTIGGIFSLSSQNFDPSGSATNAFSATLEATVIPVPAAVWLFATGILGLAGIGRRR